MTRKTRLLLGRPMLLGLAAVAVLSALMATSSGCRRASEWWSACGTGPLPNLPPGRELHGSGSYEASFDRAKVMKTADGREFPINQVLVTMAPRTSRRTVDGLAASVGGRVVGQFPTFCMYQVEVPAATHAEQESIIGRLRKHRAVRAAGEYEVGVKDLARGSHHP